MIIKNALVFGEDYSFAQSDLCLDADVITANPSGETFDATGLYAIPGLTDIHFHGCVGYDFCDGTDEAISAIAAYEAKNGITQICPATMTLPEETLLAISATAKAYKNTSGAALVGINMEGPFLSYEKKGAQNGAYLRAPDLALYRRLQEASGNLFKLVAIAPETPGAQDFIRTTKDEVVLSIAHTTADYDLAKCAIAAGASHVTHCYNAMQPFSHRAPGVIGAASEDRLEAELICDGVHIHPSAVRATFRLFGDDKVILISDSMMATGLDDGEYALGGQAVTVRGNRATLHDGTIAGSATNLMDCVRVAVRDMQIPLTTAIKCAAVNSAKSIGIDDRYGSLSVGKTANLVLLDANLKIHTVFLNGKIYFSGDDKQ